LPNLGKDLTDFAEFGQRNEKAMLERSGPKRTKFAHYIK